MPCSISVYSCPAIHCLGGPIYEGKEAKAVNLYTLEQTAGCHRSGA